MERDVTTTKLHRQLIALAFAATIVAPPTLASAQDPEEGTPTSGYKAYLAQAQELYSQEDYVGAAQAYQAAYDLKPNPNLLYNIARIYEKAGKFEEAITYYERFAREPDIKLDARKDAIERLKALREVVALDNPPDPEPDPKDTPDPEPDPDKIVKADPDPDPEPEPVGETNYTPAIITLGAGVLALGGGGAMGVLASNAATEAEGATSLGDFQAAAQNGSTYALAADGLFILGGALTITGVVLLLTASPEEASSDQAVITPVVGPDGVGVTTFMRF